MTALDSELAKYMTYAMKAYDYYCKLLGNVNADAADLVEEAKAFLKEVKAIYDEKDVEFEGKINGTSATKADEWVAELAYLVEEGSTAAKDQYIDIYNAISDLCTLYTSKSASKVIPYVEDGDIEFATLKTVKEYTAEAEDLVEQINEELGENFIYGTSEYNGFNALYTKYETFVENAAILGGDKLVNLVTNADEIIAAEETYKLIEEAVDAFDKATRVKAGQYENVFYYYTQLGANVGKLEYVDGTKTIWVADEFEKVDDILADWVAEYELSEDNMLAILAAKGIKYTANAKSTATDTYVYAAHKNALLVEAYNAFKADLAEKILDLNEVDGASIDMVLAYDEIEELFADFIVLQEADKDAEYPANIDITLDVDNFKTMVAAAEIFDDFADERLTAAFAGKTMADFETANGLINLYTFEADVEQLEDAGVYFDVDKNDNVTDNRANGDIYVFLTSTYAKIKEISKTINDKIEDLAEKVADKKLATNYDFVVLEGKYIAIPTGETFESGDETFDSTDPVYVAYTDIFTKAAEKETFFNGFKTKAASAWTIEAFKYLYPEFESMIDVADFEAAQKTMADRMNTLFTDAQSIVDLTDAIDYVRTTNAVYYEDADKDGKYDAGEEVAHTPVSLVSLNDKAAVDTAWNKYDAWVKLGGAVTMEKFANYVDADENVYDDVYYMEPLSNPSEVRASIELVRKLDLQLGAIEVAAANFIATVANVKKVDAATPFVVTLDNNTLKPDSTNSVRFFAWTKFTAATNDAARDNDGTYTVINKTAPWKTESIKTNCFDDAVGNGELAANTMTKVALLQNVVAQYDTFVTKNVEYLADAKNDYTDTEADYYQLPEYVSYAAFDAAVADYAKYDLASVKGYLLGVYTSDDDATAELRSLRKQINSATTLADLESVLYAYVAEYDDAKAYESVISAYAIYDFARLASLN
jgi:hypothetical protein